MGFRFRRRIKLFKGVHLNFGNKGITSGSVKIGNTTINSKGYTHTNIGQGLSYRTNLKGNSAPAEEVRKESINITTPSGIRKEGLKQLIITVACIILPFIFVPFALISLPVLLVIIYKNLKIILKK